jgi:hypothetical protein
MLAVGIVLVAFGIRWPEIRTDPFQSEIFFVGTPSVVIGSLLFLGAAIALGGRPWPLAAGVGVAWMLATAVLVRLGGGLSPLLGCNAVMLLVGAAVLVRLRSAWPVFGQALLLACTTATAIAILVAVRGFADWL